MVTWFLKYREAIFFLLGLLSSLVVATATAYTSWQHIVHVGSRAGEPVAVLLPVAIDGMMINSTVMAAVDRFRNRATRVWAVIGLWLGSSLTLTFNVSSAYDRGVVAMAIAAVYAVALLVTVETMFHPSQRWAKAFLASHREREVPTETESVTVAASEPVPIVPAKPSSKPGRRPGPQGKTSNRRRRPSVQGHPGAGEPAAPVVVSARTETDAQRGTQAIEAAPVFMEPEVIDADVIA
jgi:hypothetical protein